jgi:hypothetical protein
VRAVTAGQAAVVTITNTYEAAVVLAPKFTG